MEYLVARKDLCGGQAAAFLEVRNGNFFVYVKIYEPRGFYGPEVKVNLEHIDKKILDELKSRSTWAEPMSDNAQKAINEAWKQAAEKDSYFKELVY